MKAASTQDLVLALFVRQAVERLQEQEPHHHLGGVGRSPASAAIGRGAGRLDRRRDRRKVHQFVNRRELAHETVELGRALLLHEQVRRRRHAPELRELRWGTFHARHPATGQASTRGGFEKCPKVSEFDVGLDGIRGKQGR